MRFSCLATPAFLAILFYMRTRLFVLIFLLLSVFAAASDVPPERKLYDENGDRIFENLQARIQCARVNERLPVLIEYRDDTPLAGTLAVRLSNIIHSGDLKYSYNNVPVVAARLTPQQIREALKDPQVDHVEYDGVMKKAMDTASSAFGVTQARAQFKFTGDGDGDGKPGVYTTGDVVIAIIDTGIQASHPDLRGKVLFFKDFVNKRVQPYDDEGHGTHVAGVAAGAGKSNEAYAGVAPGAALVVFKVLGSDGSGEISDGIAAVDETITRKTQFNIRVLNLSLEVSGSSNGRDAFSQACNRAVANGIVTVVAAGNDGPNARTIGAPSAAAGVITVGAGADPGERGFYLADFSSRGPTSDGRIKPDLWAPGVRLRSPQRGGGYSDVSGTSFASPFVAGVAALMINARPSIKPGGVKSILLATAERWAVGTKNSDFGAGRLQAYQAIARAAAIQQDLNPPDVPNVRFLRNTINPREEQTIPFTVIGSRFPVAIMVIMLNYPSTNIDFDVTAPTGAVVAKSATFNRQEQATFLPATPGVYSIRLSEAIGTTGYFLDISGDIQ